MSVRYRDAGVDLVAAEEITGRITRRLGNCLFGGFLPVSRLKAYDSPVLVSSIDGIGTKVRLAALLGLVDGLGQDVVHHCVNDIAVHGAEPLFFLDYLACHALITGYPLGAAPGPQPEAAGCPVERIVDSIAAACDALDIVLAGGETAEMPLVYPAGHFDVAGAVVGVVEEREIIDGSSIREGDILLGLPASGLHTNGYSLVQHLFGREDYYHYLPSLGATLGEALLAPHRCYLPEIRSLLATGAVHGLAHITGGGIEGNLSRILPTEVRAAIELPPLPPIFRYLESRGIPPDEMRSVFNLGVGLIAVCDASIRHHGASYPIIGVIEPSSDSKRKVIFHDNR